MQSSVHSAGGLIAEFATGMTYDRLPDEVVAELKVQCLEVIGGLLSGSGHPYAQSFRHYASELKGGEATEPGIRGGKLYPFGDSLPVPLAITGNVGLSHCSELDPVHGTSVVCAPALIQPALWSVMPTGVSGRRYLVSAAVGTEIAIRLGLCLRGPELLSRGWWPSSICGGIGVAAALSSWMQLSAPQAEQAIAIAGLKTGGLITGGAEGPLARHYIFGSAAADGYLAILLMKSGFTGPRRVLEDSRGMVSALAPDADFSYLSGMGSSYLLTETGLKPYASSRQSHSSLSAFLYLMRTHNLSPDDIQQVEIKVPTPLAKMLNRSSYPDNGMGAVGHGQYLIAVSAYDGEVLPQQFTDQRRADPRLPNFMEKVTIIADSALDRQYPEHWPAQVTVKTSSNHYRKEVANPPGDPRNPLNDRERLDKFQRLAVPVVGEKRSMQLLDAVNRLERMDDITDLTRLLIYSRE